VAQRITDLVAETRMLTERLVRLEIERARTAFQRAAARAATGAGLLIAGAVIALVALGTFTAAAVLGLATTMPAWAAALIVGAIAAVLAGLLILLGTSRVRSATAVAPDQVVQPIKEDARWLAHESKPTSNGTSS
jgi:Putative Actinobacterial Holin-X, holin superfamily III